MKKKHIALIAGLAVVVVTAGILGGRAVAQADADAAVQTTPEESASPEPTDSAEPSFAVPTPLPSEQAAALAGQKEGEPSVTEDENGDVTIIPDWQAKAAAAHEVNSADTNMSSSGGGTMAMTNGTYEGDHPEATPTPAPAATPKVSSAPQADTTEATPQTTTPASDTSSGEAPSSDGTHQDGEISADGKYIWINGFGWINNVGPGVGTSSKGTNSELSGNKVGDM